jgi:membrane protein YdbS with pleckstrin-like domain
MSENIYYEGAPSPRLLIEWVFTILMPYTIILGLVWTLVIGFVFMMNLTLGDFVPAVALGFTSICILLSVYLLLLVMTYEYQITDKGAYFSGGIIIKKQHFVPSDKITNIIVSQNMLQLALGISNISIHVGGIGGYAKPEIVFEGLIDPDEPRNILEVYGGSSSHRYYDKYQRALRDLKLKKMQEELAEGKNSRNHSREKRMLTFEERIQRKIPFEKSHMEREDRSAQSVDTLEELFRKWKNGEIDTKEYLKSKESLENKQSY